MRRSTVVVILLIAICGLFNLFLYLRADDPVPEQQQVLELPENCPSVEIGGKVREFCAVAYATWAAYEEADSSVLSIRSRVNCTYRVVPGGALVCVSDKIWGDALYTPASVNSPRPGTDFEVVRSSPWGKGGIMLQVQTR